MTTQETSVEIAVTQTIASTGMHFYICDEYYQLDVFNQAKDYCKKNNIGHECATDELSIRFANSELKFLS